MLSTTLDPDHRLVAAELERRWNEALQRVCVIEQELAALRGSRPTRLGEATQQRLVALGEDLTQLWNHPHSSAQLKKRIVRTVVHEIVVRLGADKICMIMHWQGGDHTTIEFAKNKTGQHRWSVSEEMIELIHALARVQSDQGIAAILNRLGKRTAHGHTWNEARVRAFRNDHQIAAYREGERLERGELTLQESAKELDVSTMTLGRWIERKLLPARQACPSAPWIILRHDLDRAVAELTLGAAPRTADVDQISMQFE